MASVRRGARAVMRYFVPLYFVATMHFLGAGTDAGSPVLSFVAAGFTCAIIGLTVLRGRQARRPAPVRAFAPRTVSR